MNHAKQFIDTRMHSLEKDIIHCVKTEPYAPFPALIYCFANIDLLGSLYTGRTDNTTKQSKDYMKDFMGYTEEQSTLLQCIFRHNLVHLAEPLLSVIKYKSRLIAWKYNHYNTVNHLIFVPAKTSSNKIQVAAGWDIEFDEIFEISILGLANDILNSVYRTDGGYLQMLEKDNSIQDRFENSVESIHATIDILPHSDGTLVCKHKE
jgi:hypothetical protein